MAHYVVRYRIGTGYTEKDTDTLEQAQAFAKDIGTRPDYRGAIQILKIEMIDTFLPSERYPTA
jgi:hypothetical protein